MRVHSVVDIITNSSSTSFLYPDSSFIDEINKQIREVFGDGHLEINLCRGKIEEIIEEVGSMEDVKEKETVNNIKNIDDKYEFVNHLFKQKKYRVVYDDVYEEKNVNVTDYVDFNLCFGDKKFNISEMMAIVNSEMFEKY